MEGPKKDFRPMDKSKTIDFQSDDPKITQNNYGVRFLHPKKSTPSQFLRDIAYQINLGELYTLLGTTFYNARMDYVAVCLQIKEPILQQIYNGEFLLQVWKRGGKKIFEIVLTGKVEAWACYSNLLIYKPPKGSKWDDSIVIVDLDSPIQNQIIIKDFTEGIDDKENIFSYLFYEKTRSVLWMGNKNFIAVAPIRKYEFMS